MARSKFIEEEIDFDGIQRKMAALEPPKLALEEVLGRLRQGMIDNRKRGVTVEQIAEVLKEQGIEVGVRNLRHFIERGELMGGRPRRSASGSTAADGGTESGSGDGAGMPEGRGSVGAPAGE